jgi:cyclic dehypoxanthinyl futalosine synthase
MNRISAKEALKIYRQNNLLEIGEAADDARRELHPEGIVTFVVDRNINYTNVCVNRCDFCAFYRDADSEQAYVLPRADLFEKIQETINLGGTQILLQGGLNPALDLDYYLDMLRSIKNRFAINIHGFSPPEICFFSQKSGLSVVATLKVLRQAGLDSIPGGGAEILSDRVRATVSPNKIRSGQWLEVMREAHLMGMRTTATMMFGGIEDAAELIEHLERIRALQDETGGFTAFIPWSFQPGNTALEGRVRPATGVDYLRVLALSRIYLDNVKNLQASWVTQGIKMAQAALRFGANDFGSTMIEENVVRAAGVSFTISKSDIINAVGAAGFTAAQRDTHYNLLKVFDPIGGRT